MEHETFRAYSYLMSSLEHPFHTLFNCIVYSDRNVCDLKTVVKTLVFSTDVLTVKNTLAPPSKPRQDAELK